MRSTRFILWMILAGLVLQMAPSMDAAARSSRSAKAKKEVDNKAPRGFTSLFNGRDFTGWKVPEGDGYLAAIINFRMVANGVWWTDDAVKRIGNSV